MCVFVFVRVCVFVCVRVCVCVCVCMYNLGCTDEALKAETLQCIGVGSISKVVRPYEKIFARYARIYIQHRVIT